MNKVYVVQHQMRWDDEKKDLVPKFDLHPAGKFGELSFLLSPTAGPFNARSIIAELKEKLAKYTPDDYLLLVGNPCLIGWVVALAAKVTGGRIKLLQWSGKDGGYIEIKCTLYEDETRVSHS